MPKRDMTFDLLTKTIRFTPDEHARLRPVVLRVLSKHRTASVGDVLKDFMGLTEGGLVTKQDRKDIAPPRGRKEPNYGLDNVAGVAAHGRTATKSKTGTDD